MPNKELTDNEIVKALECCMNGHCDDDCPFRKTREHCLNLDSLILNLINRQKAEIEGLSDLLKRHQRHTKSIRILTAETAKKIKAEAYKECIKRVQKEIAQALDDNFKVRTERANKTECYIEDTFIAYCNGKIDCLRGLDDFLDNLLKELVGEDDAR